MRSQDLDSVIEITKSFSRRVLQSTEEYILQGVTGI